MTLIPQTPALHSVTQSLTLPAGVAMGFRFLPAEAGLWVALAPETESGHPEWGHCSSQTLKTSHW